MQHVSQSFIFWQIRGRSISLWRKEGTTAYRLEYAHVLNYTIDIEFCQFIHNSPLANVKTILDNNKKVMYNKNETKQSEIHRDSQY